MNKCGTKKQFTFVEALVVVAIIAVLLALLIPAVMAAKAAAKRQQDALKVEEKEIDSSTIVNGLERLAKEERSKVLLEIAPLVIEEVKGDPSFIQEYLPEMVAMTVKHSPGLALKMEGCISKELRSEVDRWKNDSNVTNLLKLEEQNKKLLEVEREYGKLKEKFADLEARIDLQKTKGVPVICYNSWSFNHCTIKATNEKTGEVFTTSMRPSSWRMLDVTPGEYEVEFHQGDSRNAYAVASVTVTTYPSAARDFPYAERNVLGNETIKYITKEGHGMFVTPP